MLKHITATSDMGVLLSNGQGWQELRRLSLTAMREMGVGKVSLEEKVMEETRVLLDTLDKLDSKPYFLKPILTRVTSNVVCNVVFGSRFEHDDPKFVGLLRHIAATFKISPVFALINFFPILRHIPMFMERAKTFAKTFEQSDQYVKTLITEHEETFDHDNIRDFVDLLIDLRLKNKDKQHFTETQMRRTIVDLFAAGSDTTATTLYWSCLYMAAHPDKQKKCQEEIDEVVGKARSVTIADKAKLGYTEATILETLRMGMIAPFTPPHSASTDTTIKGYSVPKDTLVIASLGLMNRDPETFPEPETFRPERWLDEQGNVVHRERLINFSSGPRSCLGELLAKMELNLFFPSILQFYTVRPVSEDTPVDLAFTFGITVCPNQQDLVFERR